MVTEMQRVEIPEFPVLRGEEAVEALYGFIRELEEQRGKELTDKQTTALIEFSLGLISSIEAGERSNRTIEEERRFVTRLNQLQNTFLNTLPF